MRVCESRGGDERGSELMGTRRVRVVDARLRLILELRAERATAPAAVPNVPMVFGIPDSRAEPETCSAMREETVTTPIKAMELDALPVKSVQIRRERVRSLASVGMGW